MHKKDWMFVVQKAILAAVNQYISWFEGASPVYTGKYPFRAEWRKAGSDPDKKPPYMEIQLMDSNLNLLSSLDLSLLIRESGTYEYDSSGSEFKSIITHENGLNELRIDKICNHPSSFDFESSFEYTVWDDWKGFLYLTRSVAGDHNTTEKEKKDNLKHARYIGISCDYWMTTEKMGYTLLLYKIIPSGIKRIQTSIKCEVEKPAERITTCLEYGPYQGPRKLIFEHQSAT